MKTRVGFVITGTGEGWLGGLNYYRNLLAAVASTPGCNLETIVFTGTKEEEKVFWDFPKVEFVRHRMFDRPGLIWIFRKLLQKMLGRDLMLENLLRKKGISLLSHSGFLGRGARVPTLGWIPDFQHRHLPAFFDERERARRDRLFLNTAQWCTGVVLSSENARADFVRFYPKLAHKAYVLRFVVEPPRVTQQPSRESLLAKYGLGARFLLLPNQFWEHKNHRVVVEAMAKLKVCGRSVEVVCTGNTKDNRQPQYFAELNANISRNGLEKELRILGVIPYADLVGLMKEALALVNPSLFEGWSTTVEEAKSLGKRIVLSDIGVHVEQAPPGGLYFHSNDPADLAEKLWAAWNTPEGKELRSEAENRLPGRRAEFATTYEKVVSSILGGAAEDLNR